MIVRDGVVETSSSTEEEILLPAAQVKARLELVLKHMAVWEAKGFKKLPAGTVLEDMNFLVMVIGVMNEANETLKDMLREMESAPLVGIDGRKLTTEEPRIVLASS